MTAKAMRTVRVDDVVLDELGQWQLVTAVDRRDSGWVGLNYIDGTEEEGFGGDPVTVLPTVTEPQFRTLRHVAEGVVVSGMTGTPYDTTKPWPNNLRGVSVRRLVELGLVRKVSARLRSSAKEYEYIATDAGRAVLQHGRTVTR